MKQKNKKLWKRVKAHFPFYIFMLPGLVYLVINNYLPMLGLYMSFTKVNLVDGIFRGEFVGLQNFKFLTMTTDFPLIIRNTVLYNLVFLVLNPVVGILLALFMNEIHSKRRLKVYQTTILLPSLISIQIVTYIVYAFLCVDTGLMNKTILPLLGKDAVRWYTTVKYWPAILIFVHFWMRSGFGSIVYFSSMLSISPDYYEAAELDGAAKRQQFLHITMPLLKPTIITMTIIGLGAIFKSDFGLFYQVPMGSGALHQVTQTIDTYVFRGLTGSGNLGYSAAAGFLQSVIGFVTVVVANWAIRKASPDDAMF